MLHDVVLHDVIGGHQAYILPDFIPWEPGTSCQFCRTEVKKDGGKCERRLAENGFCSSKKSHK